MIVGSGVAVLDAGFVAVARGLGTGTRADGDVDGLAGAVVGVGAGVTPRVGSGLNSR